MNDRVFSFIGGENGSWRVVSLTSIIGEPLAYVRRLNIIPGAEARLPDDAKWQLRGVTSNERYVTRAEHDLLVAKQPSLGRPPATCAALIPICKSAAWWALAQDERRRIFEETSNHVTTGLQYLPAIARRLHHCRDLGEDEPFDFLTWFEYEPSNAAAFDELVMKLRTSEEWEYVKREIEIRLERDPL
jgi:hypothetical protein